MTSTFTELVITSTAYGGKGIARENGKVFFVEDAIEGDVVKAEVTEETGRYNNAVARSLLVASPLRQPSPCAFSARCGGCQWQGVDYAQQQSWKAQFIKSALTRIGKLADTSEPVIVLPSPLPQAYRNRILLRARLTHTGMLSVGYFSRGSRDFVRINRCEIAGPRINRFIEQIEALRFRASDDRPEVKFRFEVQDLPNARDDHPHLLVSVYDPDDLKYSISEIVDAIAKLPTVKWVGSIRAQAEAPFFLFERDLDLDFYTTPGQFQQVNVPHNHTLRRMVVDWTRELRAKTVLDVFCGSGNLSLALAKAECKVRGVEFSKRAIAVAQYNCEANKIENAEYFAGDTEKFLWRAAKTQETYDLIIADPPREGMYKALIPLMKIAPKNLIYISCDPTTLARDLGSLCRKDYQIQKIVGLDFFPNSYHIETMVLLSRN